ncbi:uncharacterized protein [Haliotis asinina]|uniref:uncharacterized protein n=1 Tax=Haliotis asinina TaxID=109174 RepID=UPI00353208C3
MEMEIPWETIAIILLLVIIIIFCVCCVLRRRRNTEARSGKTDTGTIQYHKVPTSATLDLHGCSVKSALPRLEKFLKEMKQNSVGTFSIITGKGNHSLDGRPVLKPVVQNHQNKHGYKHKVDPKNAGRIIVELDYYNIV